MNKKPPDKRRKPTESERKAMQPRRNTDKLSGQAEIMLRKLNPW